MFSFNRDCPVFLLPVLVSSPFLLRINFYCSTIISDSLALPHQQTLSSPLRHLRPEFQTSAPPPSLNLIHSSRSISRLYFVRPHVLELDEFAMEEDQIPAVDHPSPPRFPIPSATTQTLPRLFIIYSIQKALNASSKDSDYYPFTPFALSPPVFLPPSNSLPASSYLQISHLYLVFRPPSCLRPLLAIEERKSARERTRDRRFSKNRTCFPFPLSFPFLLAHSRRNGSSLLEEEEEESYRSEGYSEEGERKKEESCQKKGRILYFCDLDPASFLPPFDPLHYSSPSPTDRYGLFRGQ